MCLFYTNTFIGMCMIDHSLRFSDNFILTRVSVDLETILGMLGWQGYTQMGYQTIARHYAHTHWHTHSYLGAL